MISPSTFYDLVSGRRRGISAACGRGVLRALEAPYGVAVAWRNRRYDRGTADLFRPPVPVISIGNLTTGGTGKTPLVKWTAHRLRELGLRVAILSRGYRAEQGGLNDEALELELDLPDVPHLQNPDRAASARVAVEELEMQVLLLDDGFQHRRLARDLDIVLLDALEPFGFGHLLPRGILREPRCALRRADVIVLSRADLVEAESRLCLKEEARRLAPGALWCEIRHAPHALVNARERRPWQLLAGQPVFAFCGIGNPAGYRRTLDSCGLEIVGWREFPDHHAYTGRDIEELTARCRESQAAAAVCTQKDLVKVQLAQLGPVPLWALAIETEFLAGGERLAEMLHNLTRSVRTEVPLPAGRDDPG